MKILWLVILPMLLGIIASHEAQNATSNSEDQRIVPGHTNRYVPLLIAGLVGFLVGRRMYRRKNTLDLPPNTPNSLLSNEEEMLERLISISSKIEDVEYQIKETSDTTIVKIIHAFPKIVKLELIMHELKLIINQINFAKQQMQTYLLLSRNKIKSAKLLVASNQNSTAARKAVVDMRIEKQTLENFATWATDHGFNSLMSLLRRLNDLAAPSDDESIYDLILQSSKDVSLSNCNLKQSVHQILYNLYNSISLAELKGNAILQFSYTILELYKKGNFNDEAKLSIQNYVNYAKKQSEMIQNVLSRADRSMFMCDPLHYVEGVTHTKLTRFLQGYIENEMNLSPDKTCQGNCEGYTNAESRGCSNNQFCAHQRGCKGKVINCHSVDSNMHICTSTKPERRYDWIEYESGKVLGHKGVCENKNLFSVDAWLLWSSSRCAYCLCLCDDVGKESDRYFNLREVTSDIDENKVVTGLRIVKNNQVVHIQIQQGVLAQYGMIQKNSLSWKPVDNYTIDDDDVEKDVDYYTVGLSNIIIDTNERSGPSDHVVTGVRLRKVGTHLNLQIRVTPINFTSGEVFKAGRSYWLDNDKSDVSPNRPKTEIKLIKPDIPTRYGPHTLISNRNQYIRFQPTSFEADAGQTTVPYLDSQALTSRGFALSGVGLIHRGRLGSGGFIAPKIISYDFTPHLHLNITV